MSATHNAIVPSRDLFLKTRAGFVAQGTTLSRWCRENGVRRQNAQQALIGSWDGPKARVLRHRLIEASGAQPTRAETSGGR